MLCITKCTCIHIQGLAGVTLVAQHAKNNLNDVMAMHFLGTVYNVYNVTSCDSNHMMLNAPSFKVITVAIYNQVWLQQKNASCKLWWNWDWICNSSSSFISYTFSTHTNATCIPSKNYIWIQLSSTSDLFFSSSFTTKKLALCSFSQALILYLWIQKWGLMIQAIVSYSPIAL